MPSRRAVLGLCSLTAMSALGGCSTAGEDSKPVNVLLQSDDTEEWQMTVAVERETGEEAFRTEETVPADDGINLGEVRIEDAFEGTSGDQFTVRAWLEGEPEGTYDYEITCPTDNRFSLLVEHEPYSSSDGEPLHYVDRWCAD